MDDSCELKYFVFFLATGKIIFLQIGLYCNLPPDAHKLLGFFSAPKSKIVILEMRSGGFSQKLTAILHHATAEKRACVLLQSEHLLKQVIVKSRVIVWVQEKIAIA